MSIEDRLYSRLIRITSKDRLGANETPSNFTINLSRMTETNNIRRVVVKQVDFPNYFYNITTANQDFYFGYNGGTQGSVQVPVGYYSDSQLAAVIQAGMNTEMSGVPATAAITIDPYTRIWTITVTGTDTGYLGTTQPTNTIAASIGAISNAGAFADGVPYTLDRRPNLHGVTRAYVHSTALADGNLVDSDVEVHDGLAQVPVLAPYGFYNYYESRDDELDSINYRAPKNIDLVDIQLKDIDNNFIEFPNGAGDLSVILKIYYF